MSDCQSDVRVETETVCTATGETKTSLNLQKELLHRQKKKRLKRPLFPPLLFKSLFYVWETFKPCLGHQSPNIKEFCIEDTASNMIDDNLDFSGFEEYAK